MKFQVFFFFLYQENKYLQKFVTFLRVYLYHSANLETGFLNMTGIKNISKIRGSYKT